MASYTFEDLTRMIQEAAGQDEGVEWNAEVLDVSFLDLGYDSLALLETASRVQREFSVRIEDETVAELKTPRLFVDHVNGLLRAA